MISYHPIDKILSQNSDISEEERIQIFEKLKIAAETFIPITEESDENQSIGY